MATKLQQAKNCVIKKMKAGKTKKKAIQICKQELKI